MSGLSYHMAKNMIDKAHLDNVENRMELNTVSVKQNVRSRILNSANLAQRSQAQRPITSKPWRHNMRNISSAVNLPVSKTLETMNLKLDLN